MTQWLRQSTAVTVKVGPFRDSTDGNSPETALTIQKADVRLAKNGGNMAAASADQGAADAGAPHDELGEYDVSLDTTDTNTLGRLRLTVHKTGALVVWENFMVVPANVWDSLFGADVLQVDVQQVSGAAQDIATATALATVDGVVDAIKLKTDNLPSDPADHSAIIAATDFLAAAIATVDGNVDAILVDTGTSIPALITGLNDLSAAEVANEVYDALRTDTVAEPSGVPTFPATIAGMLSRVYAGDISPMTVTASKITFSNLAGVAQWSKALSDDGTTYAEAAAAAP